MYAQLFVLTSLTSALMLGQSVTSITIGETRVSLGMARQDVIKALSSYKVRMIDHVDPGRGAVTYRPCEDDNLLCSVLQIDGAGAVASLRFKAGRLIEVHKDLNAGHEEEGVPLARALYSAIAGLVNEGKKTCTIDTSQIDGPKGSARTAFVICGERSISIQVNEGGGPSSVFLSESLVSK
jgi:hypothetical protein